MQTKFILKFFIIALSFTFLLTRTATAQAAGSLSGSVTDQSGALVPGASVTIKNSATNLTRTVTTDGEGRWTVAVLPVGKYRVTYEKEGFKKTVTENVEVEAAVPRSVEAVMEVGGSDVVITVT